MTKSRRDALKCIFSATALAGLGWAPALPKASADGPQLAAVDVLAFGAAGDGIANDTVAFHAARDAAGVGGEVVIPSGTYLVSGLEASVDNQTWKLADGATVKMATGAANILLITANDVTIDGGVFDGSNGTAIDWSQQGIRVDEADGATISNVEVRDSPMHGVYNTNGNRFTLTDCRIINQYGGGIFVLNGTTATVVSDIIITGNHVESSFDSANGIGVLGGGVAFSDRPVQRVRVSHNTIILPPPGSISTAAISVSRCRDWIISDNICEGSELGISNEMLTRAVISNNVVRKFTVIGIEISGTIDGCTVSGNVIDGTETTEASGILGASGGTQTLNRLNIVGNYIFGFTNVMTAIAITGFSESSSLTSAAIADNAIQADCSKFIGISLGLPVSNVTISGNTFDAATINTSVNGIEFQKSATNCAIFANTFKSETSGTTNFPISFGSGTASGVSVTGNTFRAGVSAGFATVQSSATLNNVTFTGNSVNGETSTFSNGIELYGSVNGLNVSENQFTNLTESIVRLLASTAVTMKNIAVIGNSVVNVPYRILNRNSGAAVVDDGSVISTD